MNSTKTLRIVRGLLVFAVVATGTAACGDDDDDNGAAGSGGESKAGSGGKGGTGGKGGAGAKGGAGGNGGSGGAKAGAGGSGGMSADDDAGVALSAADLRVTLNLLLSEHVTLAAKATGAALDKRTEEFDAYGSLLNDNGNQVGELVGAAYGESAKTKFNSIWSAHNGYFVDYTKAVATDDSAAKAMAVENLTEKYVPDFAKFLAPATGLPEKTIADLTAEHVSTTKDIVDAQAAEDWAKAYSGYRKAFAHMRMIGDALSKATASKHSDAFKGDPATKAVDLRVGLNEALQEHLYLATFATAAALGERTKEFEAAGSSLNDNGTDLGNVIGGLYGDEAKTEFNRVWSAHNGYFVDYTKAVATNNEADKKAAVDNLTTKYVPDFATLLNGATGLPVSTLKALIMEHVVMTKKVVDAQGAKKAADAAKADLDGGRHMQMIGDPVADAIVKKDPSKF